MLLFFAHLSYVSVKKRQWMYFVFFITHILTSNITIEIDKYSNIIMHTSTLVKLFIKKHLLYFSPIVTKEFL